MSEPLPAIDWEDNFDHFVALLHQSNLVPSEMIQLIISELESLRVQKIPHLLAARLVDDGLLTNWQAEQLLAGESNFVLGKYLLLEELGAGGMGAVYKASQRPMNRIVAIKVMAHKLVNDPSAIARFKREIQAAAILQHPNIVAAYDADVSNDVHFLVMEYVKGRDLDDWLRRYGRLPIDFACECIRQSACGLQHAFERGMVHRDLKPSNLMVTWPRTDGQPQIKVLDMGLARFLTSSTDIKKHSELTKSGQFVGTPYYMAPEQAMNARNADIRSDIFSLGCTLFKLLTGQLPFPGDNPMETLMARALHDAMDIRLLRDDIPAELQQVLRRMLARDPEERYQTPADLAIGLEPLTNPANLNDLPNADPRWVEARLRETQEEEEWTQLNQAGVSRRAKPSEVEPPSRPKRLPPRQPLAPSSILDPPDSAALHPPTPLFPEEERLSLPAAEMMPYPPVHDLDLFDNQPKPAAEHPTPPITPTPNLPEELDDFIPATPEVIWPSLPNSGGFAEPIVVPPTPVTAEAATEVATRRAARLLEETAHVGGSQAPDSQVGYRPQPAPTLIVGVGLVGIQCLDHIGQKVRSRLERVTSSPIRFLAIDSDETVFSVLDKQDGLRYLHDDHFLLCKPNKPNYYLERWSELEHLAQWLDPNSLFQMSLACTPNGHRSLGRLALFENYRAILGRLIQELRELRPLPTHPGDPTPKPTRDPRVFIITGMGGGTGSGMVLDLTYLIRQAFQELHFDPVDIRAMLVSGVHPRERNKELRRVNHNALHEDLMRFNTLGEPFVAQYEPKGEPHQFFDPPFHEVYFFDLTAEHSLPPTDETARDHLAEWIYHLTGSALGLRAEDLSRRRQWPKYRSPGMFSLYFPAGILLRQTACRLARDLMMNWLRLLPDTELPAIRQQLDHWLIEEKMAVQRLKEELLAEAAKEWPQSFDDAVTAIVGTVKSRIDTVAIPERLQLCEAALEQIQQLVGRDSKTPEEEFFHPPTLAEPFRRAINRAATRLAEPFIHRLQQHLDLPGPRLDLFRQQRDELIQKFNRLLDEVVQAVRQIQLLLPHLNRELQEKMRNYRNSNWLNSKKAKVLLLEALQNYVVGKAQEFLNERLHQLVLMIRSRLADLSGGMVRLRQKFERLEELFRYWSEHPDQEGIGACTQLLFPNAQLTLVEACESLYQQAVAKRTVEVEYEVHRSAFRVQGGIWSACVEHGSTEEEIAALMLSQLMRWLKQSFPASDVAACFLQRHHLDHDYGGPQEPESAKQAGADPWQLPKMQPANQPYAGAAAAELRSFYTWALPSACQRPEAQGNEKVSSPIEEHTLITIPNSLYGQRLYEMGQRVLPEVKLRMVFDRDQCIFCRILTHTSPYPLLPQWIKESQPLYEIAVQRKTGPRIFPKNSNPSQVT